MHIHFIIHEAFEAPGAFLQWAQNNNHQTSFTHLYQGDVFSETLTEPVLDQLDMLIIMGGPQSPATQDCPHFNSSQEQAVIKQAIDLNKIVIGVCLGAQMIGEALGAAYSKSPFKEIGKFPIKMTEQGKTHPFFEHFGTQPEVGHWHNDMPGLTGDAQILATSEGCPRQIVSYKEWVFGFQCHLELNKEVVAQLIANDDLSDVNNQPFVQNAETLLNHDYTQMNRLLWLFLDKVSAAYLAK